MNLLQLRQKTFFHLGKITSSEFSLLDIDRLLDEYHRKAGEIALRYSGEWEYNGEVATTDIVANQQEYLLSTDNKLISLKQIEVNLTGGTNTWRKAEVIDMRNIGRALSNDSVLNTIDKVYIRVFDNSLFLVDKPNSNVIGGLKIYYSHESPTLSLSATVEEAADKELTITGIKGATGLTVTLEQNSSDALSVTSASSTDLTIKLADTTSSKNTAALIQSAIRALGETNSMDFYNATATGSSWDNITGGTITTATDSYDVTDDIFGVDEPNLPTAVQDYLTKGAAYEYSLAYGLDNKANRLKNDMLETQSQVELHFSNKLPAQRPRLTTRQINVI
jgi:hypothetical protein